MIGGGEKMYLPHSFFVASELPLDPQTGKIDKIDSMVDLSRITKMDTCESQLQLFVGDSFHCRNNRPPAARVLVCRPKPDNAAAATSGPISPDTLFIVVIGDGDCLSTVI